MKKEFYLGLLIICSKSSWAVPPVVSPSTPVVSVGGQIQFSANAGVTWSLSPGSTGTISAGGLYSAPNSIHAKNVIAGCPALPNDHIYNTKIDNLPVDINSTARINNVGETPLGFEESFPLNVLSNTTPLTSMTFFYSTQRNGNSFPILSFPYAGVESSLLPSNYFAQDRHQLGVNTDTCRFTEIYNFYPVGTHPDCLTCNAQSGVQYEAMSYLLPDASDGGGTTDAAGLYIQPLAPRYSELKSGIIKHALRFTLSNGYIYSGTLWPATQFTNQCGTLGTCFPYGSRLRLKSSFNINSYSPTGQVILRALQQYGMILADGGIPFHIQTDGDVLSDSSTANFFTAEIGISSVSKSDFEQVNESSLMESSFSGHVNLTNAYVVPDNYANVIATRISDSVTSSVTVAIQAVTVGTKNLPFPANAGTLSVMSGTPAFQIPTWVNGSANTAVTCTMSPSLGTLTSGCLYTAPNYQLLLATTTVTLTPTADPGEAINFPLTIFPYDGIRINAGGKSAANNPSPLYDTAGNYGPDVNGKYWWSDPVGSIPLFYSRDEMFYPQTSWPSTTTLVDIALFYTGRHGSSDGAYAAMVPNNSYLLTLGFGSNGTESSVVNSSASIDSQGTVLLSIQGLVQTAYVPKVLIYPVTVSNNQFYFALRQNIATQFPLINYWSLVPVPFSQKIQGNLKYQGGLKFK